MKKTLYVCVIVCITIFCIWFGTKRTFGDAWLPFHININGEGEDEQKDGDKHTSDTIATEAFHSIEIDANVMEVRIERGDHYEVSYRATAKMVPTISVKNDKLLIEQNQKGHLTGNNNCKVTIVIPSKEELKELNAEVNVGGFKMDDFSFEKTFLTTNVGEISLHDSKLGEAKLSADTGDIKLSQCSFTDLTAKSNVGNIKIESVNDLSDYKMECTTDIGEVEMNRKEQGRKFNQDGSSYQIECRANVGDVEISW